MLIVTRKVGAKIAIGDDIVVEVREIRGKQVRLAIEAPGLAVVREELILTEDSEQRDPDD